MTRLRPKLRPPESRVRVISSLTCPRAGVRWVADTLIQGILLGGLYALFAMGQSLIFGVMRLTNTAHGDFIILAAFAAFSVVVALGLPHAIAPWVALGLLLPVGFAAGYFLQRFVLNGTDVRVFDPDPAAPYGIRLPVTHDTCELIAERWNNWLAWDPLILVEKHGAGLKKLKSLYIDCGDVDQYNLVYGARRMTRRLKALDVQHIYEEFPDNHSSVDYRMDISLTILSKALSG